MRISDWSSDVCSSDLVADNLPAWPENPIEFQCEEFRIAIGPRRQAPACKRVLLRCFPDLCCHWPILAIRSYNKMQTNHQPAFTRADPDERRQSLIEATADRKSTRLNSSH